MILIIAIAILIVAGAAVGWLLLRPATDKTVKVIPMPPNSIPAITHDASPQSVWEDEDSILSPSVSHSGISKSGASFGMLEICGKKIRIADNIDEATLKKSPGWMPDSALPGEKGMCVILGHRNSSHLRVLKDVKIGDPIRFTYADGRRVLYTAAEIMVYENSADWRLPAREDDTLMLVTCFPFHYSGNAPGKYMVVCRSLIYSGN